MLALLRRLVMSLGALAWLAMGGIEACMLSHASCAALSELLAQTQ